MKTLLAVLILLAAVYACVTSANAPFVGETTDGSVMVEVSNETVHDLAVYQSGRSTRIGTVRSFSKRCLRVWGVGNMVLYVIAFADASGPIFSPILSYHAGDAWTWTIATVAFDLAPDLVPGADCGRTRQQA